MHLRLIREPTKDGATLGSLYVDGVWQCWCLEDEIREVKGHVFKVPGQTAIPSGRYRIIITPSNRFKRALPLLLDVPQFTGIRIHAGNTVADTEGCLLVGTLRGDRRVGDSRSALEALFAKLAHAPGEIWITVENPPVYALEAA